jgi:hypothetical protein
MEQGIKGPAYEQYMEIKRAGKPVTNQDFEPIIVDNIFTQEEIDQIYEVVDSTPEDQTALKTWAGHKAWHVRLGVNIENKINEHVKKIFGDSLFLDKDYSFARYDQSYGYKAKLFPHTDMRELQRITFDIQLHADEPWGVIVDDKTYFLENNQALVFAGTQQPHWREKKDIKPESKIDMIFCHLEHKDVVPYDDHQEHVLFERVRFLSEFYDLEATDEPYTG